MPPDVLRPLLNFPCTWAVHVDTDQLCRVDPNALAKAFYSSKGVGSIIVLGTLTEDSFLRQELKFDLGSAHHRYEHLVKLIESLPMSTEAEPIISWHELGRQQLLTDPKHRLAVCVAMLEFHLSKNGLADEFARTLWATRNSANMPGVTNHHKAAIINAIGQFAAILEGHISLVNKGTDRAILRCLLEEVNHELSTRDAFFVTAFMQIIFTATIMQEEAAERVIPPKQLATHDRQIGEFS